MVFRAESCESHIEMSDQSTMDVPQVFRQNQTSDVMVTSFIFVCVCVCGCCSTQDRGLENIKEVVDYDFILLTLVSV